MNKVILFFILCGSLVTEAAAQETLQNYIDSAMNNNIVLQQKNISLQQASYALKIAKSMFYPSVSIQAGYQTANGGRDIEIPVGDMLNGVYTTLNKLTQSQKFPQLENQQIDFLPTNFYDAKIHTTVPIINPSLSYNRRIKQHQIQLSHYEIEIYKRELIKKVKTGYYTYLQSLDAIEIYQSALSVAKEGKRVNERLLKNGKGLPAYVLRANSEIESVKAQLITARQKADNAKRYFNFILNRNQNAPIDTVTKARQLEKKVVQFLHQEATVSGREELKELQQSISLQEDVNKMNKSAYYPTLNGFLDLGSQSENWKFDDQSRYYMAGIQLNIPLFKGNRNRFKIKQSELAVQDAQLNLRLIKQKLKLSSRVAKNNLRSAYESFLSSKKSLKSANAYQRLILRGYREGVNAYLETIDARNQLTKSRLAVSINRYKMLKALADLERATASYNIN